MDSWCADKEKWIKYARTFFLLLSITICVPCIYLLLMGISRGIGLSAKGPLDFPDSTWASENPGISMHVLDNVISYRSQETYIISNEQKQRVNILIEAGRPYAFILDYNDSNIILLEGKVRRITKHTVQIDVINDSLFGNSYSTIVLKRTN